MNGHDRYIIGKGFIDGKDKSARQVYGVFVAVAFGRDLVYLKEHFSWSCIDRNLPWADIVHLFGDGESENVDEGLLRAEKELHHYLETSRLFQSGSRPLEAKEIERKITYFCSDTLEIGVITFVELASVVREDLLSLLPFLNTLPGAPGGETEDGGAHMWSASEESVFFKEENQAPQKELFVACEPVLDPVDGKAASDLSVGDNIMCRLPSESIYYKFFVSRLPGFDGTIVGEMTGIKIRESGHAVIALDLADGIAGVMKLPGKVRIRLAEKRTPAEEEGGGKSVEMILAGASVILFLCLMGTLLYLLS